MVKLLFADMYINVSLCRLPAQFKKLGAENFGLGYKERLLLKGGNFKQKYKFPGTPKDISFKNMTNGLLFAATHCRPDFLLANDEALISGLLQLRENLRASETQLAEDKQHLLALLDTSLAPDRNIYKRDVSVQLAEDAGFPIPLHVTVHSLDQLTSCVAVQPRPFFIKLSFAAGGTGVTLIAEDTDIKQVLDKIAKSGFPITKDRPALLQSVAEGDELTVSFAAWKGQLLGYTVVKPLETLFNNGPSSVIQNLYRPHWEAPLKALVQKLQFNGFGGLDVFERSTDQLPSVIEVNLRPTHTLPTSPMLGNDLVSLFFDKLSGTGKATSGVQHILNEKIVALFPDEVMRDRNSPYLKTVPLDISWNDPHLNHALTEFIYKKSKSN